LAACLTAAVATPRTSAAPRSWARWSWPATTPTTSSIFSASISWLVVSARRTWVNALS
jgi:hypothetical protein